MEKRILPQFRYGLQKAVGWKAACYSSSTMRTILLMMTAATVIAFGADFETGLKAYKAGDYAGALENWRTLAEQGAPHAQYNVGLMYALGNGVACNPAEAARWYRMAAEQGVAQAQFNLGLMSLEGEGVAKDAEEAKKWFTKA